MLALDVVLLAQESFELAPTANLSSCESYSHG